MKDNTWQLNSAKDHFLRCILLRRLSLSFFSLVILISLCNANPAFSLSPEWSQVRSEPFLLSGAPEVVNPVLTAGDVDDVNAEFVADPFLFQANNIWYLFFEVLNEDRGIGEIGVATSNDGLVWDYNGIVLREDYHLSYPLVFEHDGTYYMIPDISGTTGVWLYQATEFPFQWEYVATLVDGKNYADATVFNYNGTWWMFAGEGWTSGRGTCYLFYSDDLLSGWTEHPKSPIVIDDAGIARPGGRSFVFDTNRVVRIAQKDDVIYGQRVRAFEIDQLTETDYQEHEISQSPILYESGNGWNASGMHTFSPWWTGSKWIAAVDGQIDEIWSIGIYVADSSCPLDPRFNQTSLAVGMEYYTDRDYKFTAVPSPYLGMETITTPNEDRNLTIPAGYLTMEMPFDGMVYVAYDSRATSLPNWMNDFTDTGDRIYTSLDTQPYLKVYSKPYSAGSCVNLGANKADGFAGGTVSNYVAFYGDGSVPSTCSLSTKFVETTLGNGIKYYTDREYRLTSVPSDYVGMDTILTPNEDRDLTTSTGYLTIEMPFDGMVYVGYDSRATSLPNWMNDFTDTGDRIYTSLDTQPYLEVYSKPYSAGRCVNLGANKADGFAGGTVSNYVVFYGDGSVPPTCSLSSKFVEATLGNGIKYYTDREYRLTSVPSDYVGMDTILTPNEDRNLTTPIGYLNLEMPFDGMVYVAYDSRATGLPNWMDGFIDTGDVLLTSLSSQPSLKIYSQMYDEGDCVNLGANKSPGFIGGTVSNYIVFYSDGNIGPVECTLDTTFEISTMAMSTYYYTDRTYMITGGLPEWMLGLMLIQPPNDDRFSNAANGYIRFTNPGSSWVYVLFDSRSASIPTWLNGWEMLSDKITTSLDTQPYLKVYRKMFDAGQCVDLGGNYGPGSSGETRSNYVVVYGN